MAVTNNLIPYILYPIAERYVGSGVTGILSSFGPVAAFLIGHSWLVRSLVFLAANCMAITFDKKTKKSEQVTITRGLALLAGFPGCAIIFVPQAESEEGKT